MCLKPGASWMLQDATCAAQSAVLAGDNWPENGNPVLKSIQVRPGMGYWSSPQVLQPVFITAIKHGSKVKVKLGLSLILKTVSVLLFPE